MIEPNDHFQSPDDARLKASLKRVLGSHQAAPELRARISAAMGIDAADSVGKAAKPVRSQWKSWQALAASLLLAVAGYQLYQQFNQPRRPSYSDSNQDVLKAMVAAHRDAASAGIDVALPTTGDAASIQQEAARHLGRYVPVPDLSGRGWKLESASLGTIRGSRSAFFRFTSQGRRITLISMPQYGTMSVGEGQTYQTGVDGYPIAGYGAKGGVHCLVGDGDGRCEPLMPLILALQAAEKKS